MTRPVKERKEIGLSHETPVDFFPPLVRFVRFERSVRGSRVTLVYLAPVLGERRESERRKAFPWSIIRLFVLLRRPSEERVFPKLQQNTDKSAGGLAANEEVGSQVSRRESPHWCAANHMTTISALDWPRR